MKNLFAVASVAILLPVIGFASDSEAYVYNKDMYGEFNVTVESETGDTNEKVNSSTDDGHFYLGGRAELSFLNWKNEYKDETGAKLGHDDFDFKPVIGLNLFAGYRFNKDFRADLEIGYIGAYSESETEYPAGFPPHRDTFELKSYYATANAYYNLTKSWYVGAGAGVAMPNVSVDDSWFGKKSKSSVTPMGALMLGWVYQLDEDTDLDLRYRFSMFDGGNVTISTGATTSIKTDIGYVMDNSVSVGIRSYF